MAGRTLKEKVVANISLDKGLSRLPYLNQYRLLTYIVSKINPYLLPDVCDFLYNFKNQELITDATKGYGALFRDYWLNGGILKDIREELFRAIGTIEVNLPKIKNVEDLEMFETMLKEQVLPAFPRLTKYKTDKTIIYPKYFFSEVLEGITVGKKDVRSQWDAVERFLSFDAHKATMWDQIRVMDYFITKIDESLRLKLHKRLMRTGKSPKLDSSGLCDWSHIFWLMYDWDTDNEAAWDKLDDLTREALRDVNFDSTKGEELEKEISEALAKVKVPEALLALEDAPYVNLTYVAAGMGITELDYNAIFKNTLVGDVPDVDGLSAEEAVAKMLHYNPEDYSRAEHCKMLTYLTYKINPQLLPDVVRYCCSDKPLVTTYAKNWRFIATDYYYRSVGELSSYRDALDDTVRYIISNRNKSIPFNDEILYEVLGMWSKDYPRTADKFFKLEVNDLTIDEQYFFPDIIDEVKKTLETIAIQGKLIALDKMEDLTPSEQVELLTPKEITPDVEPLPIFLHKITF